MKYAGRATIRVDAAVLETDSGATLDIGGVMRSTVSGANQVLGYAEAPKPARLECEVFITEGVSLERLRQISAATITFTTDTGQSWVLSNAWLTEPPVFTQAGEGGKARLVFEAPPAEEAACWTQAQRSRRQ